MKNKLLLEELKRFNKIIGYDPKNPMINEDTESESVNSIISKLKPDLPLNDTSDKIESILLLQKTLVALGKLNKTYGIDGDGVDGDFGNDTKNALKNTINSTELSDDNVNKFEGVLEKNKSKITNVISDYETFIEKFKEMGGVSVDYMLICTTGKGTKRLRKSFPMTPEYVLKDFFYNNVVNEFETIEKEFYGEPLLMTRGYWGDYLRGPWKLEILDVNPKDFDDKTLNAFLERDFGNVNTYQVPDDEERTQTQRRLAKPTGMNEPVIVELKPNGKYELIEGWHRTMSILLLGDNGEDLKNWDKVKIRAFVRDLSKLPK